LNLTSMPLPPDFCAALTFMNGAPDYMILNIAGPLRRRRVCKPRTAV
jgi:hypothetical protein